MWLVRVALQRPYTFVVMSMLIVILGLLIDLIGLAWALYNAYQAGETGQSYGKRMTGIKLLRESDGGFIGGGAAIGRYFVHILDSLACLLGWLWPLAPPFPCSIE